MSDKLTQEKFDRAVLVGLNAFSMSQEENATEETMEELAALLETAGERPWVWSPSPRTAQTPHLYRGGKDGRGKRAGPGHGCQHGRL